MKKALIVLALVLIAAFATTACSNGGSAEPAPQSETTEWVEPQNWQQFGYQYGKLFHSACVDSECFFENNSYSGSMNQTMSTLPAGKVKDTMTRLTDSYRKWHIQYRMDQCKDDPQYGDCPDIVDILKYTGRAISGGLSDLALGATSLPAS